MVKLGLLSSLLLVSEISVFAVGIIISYSHMRFSVFDD
jgi:hypothetical protein